MKYFFIIFVLVSLVIVSGCSTEQPKILVDNESDIVDDSVNLTPEEPPVNTTPIEIYDSKITSLECKWTVKTNEYNVKSDCVRIIAKGTAQGPVGARLELPILAWSDDLFDCGEWTSKKGALIAVGHTCERSEGQPEKTNFTIDTGGDNCPLKNYFNSDRSYGVKIYPKGDIYSKAEDSEDYQCG